jgi:hypothetical protein
MLLPKMRLMMLAALMPLQVERARDGQVEAQ